MSKHNETAGPLFRPASRMVLPCKPALGAARGVNAFDGTGTPRVSALASAYTVGHVLRRDCLVVFLGRHRAGLLAQASTFAIGVQ